MSTRKTIGLALGSGAYRGFAHIGVIKSLEKHHMPIDFLSGSSIGAWVAAYYAVFKDISKLEKDLINNQKENISLLFDFDWTGGLIGGGKFVTYLEKKLQHYNFTNLKIPLKIVATDLANGQEVILEHGDVAQAVRASTSVPLIFKPLPYKDKLLVDGGLSNPVPGDVVRNMGADIVIGVNLYNQNDFVAGKITMPNIFARSTMIAIYNLAQITSKYCDILIEPDTSRFVKKNTLAKYFTKKVADEMIFIGEKATDKIIPTLKAKLEL